MGDLVTINTKAIASLSADLEKAGKDVAKHLDSYVDEALEIVQKEAVRRAPRKSGALERSIKIRTKGDGDRGAVVADIVYGKWQHFVGQKGRSGFMYLWEAVKAERAKLEKEAARYAADRIDKSVKDHY